LVKQRKLTAAIAYSKKHLIGWSETHLREIQQASGLLAFDPSTTCPMYKVFFEFIRHCMMKKDGNIWFNYSCKTTFNSLT
jgi:hypothetical protein